jgi:hypothetical protein
MIGIFYIVKIKCLHTIDPQINIFLKNFSFFSDFNIIKK